MTSAEIQPTECARRSEPCAGLAGWPARLSAGWPSSARHRSGMEPSDAGSGRRGGVVSSPGVGARRRTRSLLRDRAATESAGTRRWRGWRSERGVSAARELLLGDRTGLLGIGRVVRRGKRGFSSAAVTEPSLSPSKIVKSCGPMGDPPRPPPAGAGACTPAGGACAPIPIGAVPMTAAAPAHASARRRSTSTELT